MVLHHCGALEHINGAQVVLIPKSEVALEPKDFRPISLIHTFAKLFTKVLSIRLAAHIDSLVGVTQSTFIKKRCIQDNFVYVRELARHFHRTETPACLLNLDISNAFDTRWTSWLAALLRSSSSMVLLNGCPRPRIQHQRGLRSSMAIHCLPSYSS